IPRKNITRLGLNYEGIIPEVNQRNNYKRVSSLLNKPLQMRLFKDVEDPRYAQFFILPQFSYNLYDGFSLGPRISNKALLPKDFTYEISPKYGFVSHDIVGSLFVYNTHQFRNKNLYNIQYGVSGNRYSYDRNLFYYRFSPFISFAFRHRDLRK